MMKSLVVNCSLDRHAKIKDLKGVVEKFSECSIVQFRDIRTGYRIEKDIDAVFLSGSKARIVNPSHRDMFSETIDLIKFSDIPTLGICYGHQLICWVLGCEVAPLNEPVIDRFEEVRLLEVDELFDGFETSTTIPFVQSHYDYVLRDSLNAADLVPLADSASCQVEAVKHKSIPFYGVQFHPERTNIKGQIHKEGHRVIGNFFKNIVKR